MFILKNALCTRLNFTLSIPDRAGFFYVLENYIILSAACKITIKGSSLTELESCLTPRLGNLGSNAQDEPVMACFYPLSVTTCAAVGLTRADVQWSIHVLSLSLHFPSSITQAHAAALLIIAASLPCSNRGVGKSNAFWFSLYKAKSVNHCCTFFVCVLILNVINLRFSEECESFSSNNFQLLWQNIIITGPFQHFTHNLRQYLAKQPKYLTS